MERTFLDEFGYEILDELILNKFKNCIFQISDLENPLTCPIRVLYSSFENLNIFEVDCFNDLLNCIDAKSEIPEVIGYEKYRNSIIQELTSYSRNGSFYLPIKHGTETLTYRCDILRMLDKHAAVFHLSRVDRSKLDIEGLYFDSYKDPLTGLFNKNTMEKHFSTTTGHHFVGFMDIDNFKEFNDHYSHDSGDDLLRKIGEMFIAISDPRTIYYRRSGDEFLFFTINTNFEELNQLVTKIQKAVNQLDFKGAKISFSIGIAEYDDLLSYSIYDCVNGADLAMYISKQKGKNCSTFINPEQLETLLRENKLTDQLEKYHQHKR